MNSISFQRQATISHTEKITRQIIPTNVNESIAKYIASKNVKLREQAADTFYKELNAKPATLSPEEELKAKIAQFKKLH